MAILKIFSILFLFALSAAAAVSAQTNFHTIYLNANQDADFTVTIGQKIYTKADAVEVEPNIKAGRPGDPFKGWKIISSEPATKYIVEFKPLLGYYADIGGYEKIYEIPAGYDYFTYQTNMTYEPTEISARVSFYGASWEEEKTLRAPFTITGPQKYSGQAGDVFNEWKAEKVPWGNYTITWGNLPGYEYENSSPETLVISTETIAKETGTTPYGKSYQVVGTGKITFHATYQKKASPQVQQAPQAPSLPQTPQQEISPEPKPQIEENVQKEISPSPMPVRTTIIEKPAAEKSPGFLPKIIQAIISFFQNLFKW